MMKDDPIPAQLPTSTGDASSPNQRPSASSAEPSRGVITISGLDGAVEHRHTQAAASGTAHQASFSLFNNRAQNKVLDVVAKLRDAFVTKRKASHVKETVAGSDMILWLRDVHNIPKPSGVHLVHLLSVLGFIVAIPAGPGLRHTESRSTADKTRYRFQNADYLPNNIDRNTDKEYAAYLYRVIQLSSHAHHLPYEQEALDCLQHLHSADWREIQQQAMQRRRLLKSMPGEERHACYLFERKFWRVMRPPPHSGCPLQTAQHPWQERNSHHRLVAHSHRCGGGVARDCSHTSSTITSSSDGSGRRRSRSVGSREQEDRRRWRVRVGAGGVGMLKQLPRDVTSLPTAVHSTSSATERRELLLVSQQQERNALWLRTLQDPLSGGAAALGAAADPALSTAGPPPSLASITGRADLARIPSGPAADDVGGMPTVTSAAAAESGDVLAPLGLPQTSSGGQLRVSQDTDRDGKLTPERERSLSPSPSPGGGGSGSEDDTSARTGWPDSSLLHSSITATNVIHELSGEDVTKSEVESLEARLHQPYLSVERILGVHKKFCAERRDLDMLCSGSPSSAQNHWTSSHGEVSPVADITMVSSHKVRLWAISFDALLHDPRGSLEFDNFLQKEFAAENIQFWKEADVYRNLPTSQLADRSALLYKEFIQQNCLSQINIPASVHMDIRKQLDAEPTRFLFDSAQRQVYHLMRKDSYARFLQSQQFKDLQKSAPQNRALGSHNLFRSFRMRRSSTTGVSFSGRYSTSGVSAGSGGGEKREKSQSSGKADVGELTARLKAGKQPSASPERQLSLSSPTPRKHGSSASFGAMLSSPVEAKSLSKQFSAPISSGGKNRGPSSVSSAAAPAGERPTCPLPQETYSGKRLTRQVSMSQCDDDADGISTATATTTATAASPSLNNERKVFSLPIETLMSDDSSTPLPSSAAQTNDTAANSRDSTGLVSLGTSTAGGRSSDNSASTSVAVSRNGSRTAVPHLSVVAATTDDRQGLRAVPDEDDAFMAAAATPTKMARPPPSSNASVSTEELPCEGEELDDPGHVSSSSEVASTSPSPSPSLHSVSPGGDGAASRTKLGKKTKTKTKKNGSFSAALGHRSTGSSVGSAAGDGRAVSPGKHEQQRHAEGLFSRSRLSSYGQVFSRSRTMSTNEHGAPRSLSPLHALANKLHLTNATSSSHHELASESGSAVLPHARSCSTGDVSGVGIAAKTTTAATGAGGGAGGRVLPTASLSLDSTDCPTRSVDDLLIGNAGDKRPTSVTSGSHTHAPPRRLTMKQLFGSLND